MRKTNLILKLLSLTLLLAGPLLSPVKGYSQPPFLDTEYLKIIQNRISPHIIYPKEAQIKGWEGRVKVKFIFTQDGSIRKIDVAESSGYPVLDAAAISAVKDASPYPFPKNYSQDELEIILQVNYAGDKTSPPTESQPSQTTQSTNVQKELTQFIDLAVENNEPLKVAREEIESVQLKVTEAKRNLFPALKLLGYTTEGEFSKVDFEENEARVQLDQPLYYGARLTDTIKQARANLEITKKNYDRLKFDLMQKTETAYYKLAVSKKHLIQKEALKQEAEELLEKIEKLSLAGLVIPLEVSGARAWFEQIGFQVESVKQDLSMAELTFRQVLNIKQAPDIHAELLEAANLNLDLDTCLNAAFQHRPEISISRSLIKFYDYGKRIEVNKSNAFTVDLTSFYGHYRGHFTNDPWARSDNWYAGVKVTKPWGGNTLNTSYNQERVLPRLGQTSPNESATTNAEFNLLDNLKSRYDKKKSEIDLHRSLSDLDETRKSITAEVQEAFLNYQKAALQLKATETEMKFRRNDADVTRIRAMVLETSLSNAVASLNELSETQTKYIQALTNYQISLVNLKKACGYSLKI